MRERSSIAARRRIDRRPAPRRAIVTHSLPANLRRYAMLQGKVAIVTGSTSGIGLGIARALAAQGASVMLNGFGDKAEIEKLRQEIAQAHGVKVGYSAADMSKSGDIREMVQQAAKELGSVDVLVNNAGIQFTAPVDEFPEDKWNAIIAINLSAAFHAIKAALPLMKQRKWGRVINIASA